MAGTVLGAGDINSRNKRGSSPKEEADSKDHCTCWQFPVPRSTRSGDGGSRLNLAARKGLPEEGWEAEVNNWRASMRAEVSRELLTALQLEMHRPALL